MDYILFTMCAQKYHSGAVKKLARQFTSTNSNKNRKQRKTAKKKCK